VQVTGAELLERRRVRGLPQPALLKHLFGNTASRNNGIIDRSKPRLVAIPLKRANRERKRVDKSPVPVKADLFRLGPGHAAESLCLFAEGVHQLNGRRSGGHVLVALATRRWRWHGQKGRPAPSLLPRELHGGYSGRRLGSVILAQQASKSKI